MLRLTAPLPEAQIVETFLLNTLAFETAIASKAARISIAAAGKPVIDFSPRRDHGVDAALKVARASFIGGATGTSNVLAGSAYEFAPYHCRVDIALVGDAAGAPRCTVQVGSDVLLEESPVSRQARVPQGSP